jgi:hypothetical protein
MNHDWDWLDLVFNPFLWIILFLMVFAFGMLAGAHFAQPAMISECGGVSI